MPYACGPIRTNSICTTISEARMIIFALAVNLAAQKILWFVVLNSPKETYVD